jgi:predicted kinase
VTLIVVSGAPGTGKSTIATAIATDLRWPLLSLDPVKELLADVLGLGDEDWSDRLGDAAAEVIFRQAVSFPEAVAEGWWRRARRDRAVEIFAGAIEVFCHCEPELALRRMRDRHGVSRHPIHRDVINPAMLKRASELAATVTPLALGAGLITTNTGQEGAAAAAVAGARAALRR